MYGLPCHQLTYKYKTFAIEAKVSSNNFFPPHMLYVWHQGKLFWIFFIIITKSFFCSWRHLLMLKTYSLHGVSFYFRHIKDIKAGYSWHVVESCKIYVYLALRCNLSSHSKANKIYDHDINLVSFDKVVMRIVNHVC